MSTERESSTLVDDGLFSIPIPLQIGQRKPDISDIQLTKRQVELLQLVAEGLGTKEVAYRMERSVETVNKGLSAIYRKLRRAENLAFTPNYVGAIVFAYKSGILQTSELEESARLAGLLSKREKEVGELLLTGSSDKEIAQKLGVSIFTANKHVANILYKLGVSGRKDAVLRLLIYNDMAKG